MTQSRFNYEAALLFLNQQIFISFNVIRATFKLKGRIKFKRRKSWDKKRKLVGVIGFSRRDAFGRTYDLPDSAESGRASNRK